MTPRLLLFTLTVPLLGFACCGPDRAAKPAAGDPPTAAAPTAAEPAQREMPEPRENADSPAADSPATDAPAAEEVATFGGGCFWCTEAVLEQLDGVKAVTAGYMGGEVDDPTYKQVCAGTTGHAEVVQVTFDPAVISYEKLLEWFFRSHDPTTLNRQGYDVGTQYRSAIFFHDEGQHRTAVKLIEQIAPNWQDPIVTEVTEAVTFWPAEDYHQDYYRGNTSQGYCRAVILPKLKKLGLDVNGREAAKQ
ncbi:MAG: peptide-methionine (S)-S-oxide reductase MsrA [Planctomycetota bacterium]